MPEPVDPVPGDQVEHVLFRHGVGAVLRIETHGDCPNSVCAITQWSTAAFPTCEALPSLRIVVPGGAR